MPPLTASVMGKVGETLGLPEGTIEKFEMETCNISTIHPEKEGKEANQDFPVLVFSPGFAGTRLIYGAFARSLASLGYIVITVDHPYEAYIVEFPDGTVAYPSSDEEVTILQLEVSLPLIVANTAHGPIC
jgi:hypothetical protein